MRLLIGLPDGKELSWKHIKHPILPCQCPRVRSIICEEENGSCMFEKVIAGLHTIQRSVPQMPRAVDVSKEIVIGGFALNAKAMRELSRKLYDGEIVEDALDNKWGRRGKKRKQVMENWSSFELAFPCNFARVDEVGPFWEGQLCLRLRKITFVEQEMLEGKQSPTSEERQHLILSLKRPETTEIGDLLGAPVENNISCLVFSTVDFPPGEDGDTENIKSTFSDVTTHVRVNSYLQGNPVVAAESTGGKRVFRCAKYRSGCRFNFTVKRGSFAFYIHLCGSGSRENFGTCLHRCECVNPVPDSDSDSDESSCSCF